LRSETDTEVAANLISDFLSDSDSIIIALQKTLKRLEGEFAICGIIADQPNTIFAIKRKSPLVVGKLEEGIIFSSDRTAFGEFLPNMDILYLEDESILLYTDKEVSLWQVIDSNLIESIPDYKNETLEEQQTSLKGFPHYMLKEIHDTPLAIKIIAKNLKNVKKKIVDEMISSEISMTGAGSTYYVAMIGQYFFNNIGGIYAPAYSSDEYLNLKFLSRRNLIIAISQSGETFDTLEVIRMAKKNKAAIVTINNTPNSSMQRLADYHIYQEAGKEVCVLSTKSIISQVSILYLLSVEVGLRTGKLTENNFSSLLEDYEKFSNVINLVLSDYAYDIKRIAYQNCNIEHWFFIGRGAHYPVALESALKFKEVSYLHAEGMPAGFFKHGTISLIDENFYTIVFIPSPINDHNLYQATLDNIYEVNARGGNIIGIGHQIPTSVRNDLFFDYISLPDINKSLNIMIQLVAGQLLAYYSAVALKRNIDKPRALAKSVTVR